MHMVRRIIRGPDKERNPVAARLMRRVKSSPATSAWPVALGVAVSLVVCAMCTFGVGGGIYGRAGLVSISGLQFLVLAGAIFMPMIVALLTAILIAQDMRSGGNDLLRLTNLPPKVLVDAYYVAGGYRARRFLGVAAGLMVFLACSSLFTLFITMDYGGYGSVYTPAASLIIEWVLLAVLNGIGLWGLNLTAVALGVRVGVAGTSPGNAAFLAGFYMMMLMGLLACGSSIFATMVASMNWGLGGISGLSTCLCNSLFFMVAPYFTVSLLLKDANAVLVRRGW